MVHSKRGVYAHILGPRDVANEYWKLELQPSEGAGLYTLRSILDERGYYYEAHATQERLRQLVLRCSLRLLSYDKYTLEDLKKFAANRRLPLTVEKTREDLITVLERADEHSTFDRILDLPPELRNAIFQFHFADFDTCDGTVSPPLARASRQLHQETLPSFYGTCTIKVSFSRSEYTRGITYVKHRRQPDQPLFPDRTTHMLFSQVPEHLLGNARRFELGGYVFGIGFSEYDLWHVDFGKESGEGLLSLKPPGPRPFSQKPPNGYEVAREKLEETMRAQLGAIAMRLGTQKLRRTDLEILQRLFMVTVDWEVEPDSERQDDNDEDGYYDDEDGYSDDEDLYDDF